MRYRSPARFLAPLALIASAFAVYTLVQPEMDSGSASSSPSTATQVQTTSVKKAPAGSLRRAKTYKVKPGDTLSGIAVKTGLTVIHIQRLNTGLDANTLLVGRTLKLRE
jgi:LysM repeat protein